MSVEKRKAGNQPNLVSSFRIAFLGTSGSVESLCIKFSMFDGTTRLSCWQPKWLLALYKCIEYYSAMHYYGSDLQRTAQEPSLVATLPRRHPVRTMNDEKPDLTEEDYQEASKLFPVASFAFIDQGGICHIDCTYSNGYRRIEVLPAYIAMNLCATLKAIVEASGLWALKAVGTA